MSVRGGTLTSLSCEELGSITGIAIRRRKGEPRRKHYQTQYPLQGATLLMMQNIASSITGIAKVTYSSQPEVTFVIEFTDSVTCADEANKICVEYLRRICTYLDRLRRNARETPAAMAVNSEVRRDDFMRG